MSGIADGGITTSVGDDRPRGKRAPDARGDGVQHDAGAAAEVLGRDRGKGLSHGRRRAEDDEDKGDDED
jgi:hypothetical protein